MKLIHKLCKKISNKSNELRTVFQNYNNQKHFDIKKKHSPFETAKSYKRAKGMKFPFPFQHV